MMAGKSAVKKTTRGGSGPAAGTPSAGMTLPDAVQDSVAPPPASFQGYVDGLDAHWHVVGWARPLRGGDERVIVELVENGRVVARETAMRFRGDLVDAGIGDGKYGFQLGIEPGLFDGMRHELGVRVVQDGQDAAMLGALDIMLPSRLPKAGQRVDAAARASQLVDGVLGDAAAQTAAYFETYIQHLTVALDAVARQFDFATALGLLYVHILRRHIDGGGLQTRLMRLSMRPEELGEVVREIMQSEEALGRIKKLGGYQLPGLEAIQAWTRLRPVA
ncbi:hypothetical protein [Acidocella sp.]|uniref:hypothetical protein n=1 Tax=Acidocella sp. TaxID=50710 RepID=UPI002620EBBD|nr:hypothetical protein [Acidocella sp.]